MRFQKLTVVEVKRILHVARRMVFRDVERLETVVIVDNLKVILDDKSH